MLPLISSAYFHDFLESLGNGVLLCNIRGEVYAVNRAAAAILGLPGPDGCIGAVPAQLFKDLRNPIEFLDFFELMANSEQAPRSFRSVLPRSDGPDVHIALHVSRLNESGKLFGLMITVTDISDVVHLNEREKTILRDLASLSREKHDSLRHFADAVAHQLRNPLMTIGGFAGIMRRKREESDPDCPRLDAIVDSAKRLERIVTAVSGYNALAARDLNPTSVEGAVAQAVFELTRKLPVAANRTDIQVDTCDAILPLDQGLFAAALEDVLENALEAENSSAITVTGRVAEGRYQLAVSDNGAGISPDLSPFVFDFFFSTKSDGLGMGLCRARKIAMEHHGALTLHSRPGQGATATFDLPLTR